MGNVLAGERTLTSMNGKLYRLSRYYPYRLPDGSVNPKVDNTSRKMMDFKNPGVHGHNASIDFFGAKLEAGLKGVFGPLGIDEIQIAIAPSSTKGKVSSGLTGILKYAESAVDVIYSPQFLVRTKSIKPAHSGGSRLKQLHLDTIKVEEIPASNTPLVLLDDVKSTGNTIDACEELLRSAGVTTIIKIAVGINS